MLYINNFRIRKLDQNDVDFITNLRSDHEVNSMLGHFIFVSRQSQLNWINALETQKDKMYFIFETQNNETWERVGIIRIGDIDFINRSASVGGDIIKNFRGKGFSKEMFKLIFKLCFDYLNLNRLWLCVLENNDKAINLYNKMGFVKEGVQRKAIFREGNYLDYIMMSLISNEYKN